MKIAFLCNISLRWGNALPKIKKLIEKHISQKKDFFVVDKNDSNSTEKCLEKIVSENFDAIAILGGDGTVNRVINFLKKKNHLEKFKLALIPFGTCNDFSKVLGFKSQRFRKKKIISFLKTLSENHAKSFSVAKVNDHYFINNAGFGRRVPAANGKKSSIRDIRTMTPVHLNVRFDSKQLEGKYLMMVCANAPYFSGGLHFSKDSDPCDDQLELFFVKDVNKLRLIGKLFLGRRGFSLKRKNDKTIERIESSKLSLKSESPIWIMADGEAVPELSGICEATFEIDGKAHFILP